MAGDVREFVGKHDAAAVFGPLRGTGGQDDDGAKDSPSERHRGGAVALQKTDWSSRFCGTWRVPRRCESNRRQRGASHARRPTRGELDPTKSLSRKNEKPTAQTRSVAPASLLKNGGAAVTLTMLEGIVCEMELPAFACAGLQKVAALPSVAECHAGSSIAKKGSASEARMAAVQTWWRSAAGTLAQSDNDEPCTGEKNGGLGATRDEKCERLFIIGERTRHHNG